MATNALVSCLLSDESGAMWVSSVELQLLLEVVRCAGVVRNVLYYLDRCHS